jgi:hypothetical protein
VLPLSDHRGLAVQGVRAWSEQSLAPEQYEVVAVGDGRRPRLHEQVRRVLRPRDRLLTFPGAGEIELYRGGAAAAAGATLLFTESHCIPERDTAFELVRFLGESGAKAATLRSGHLARGGLAALEAALGDRASAGCPPERWWSVASLRGLAVRRDEFDRAGGFFAAC